MLVEDGTLPECTLAVYASIRLLVSMYAQMLREMGLLTEPLAALRTSVRPAVCVDPLVLQQSRFLLKIFAAGQALEQT